MEDEQEKMEEEMESQADAQAEAQADAQAESEAWKENYGVPSEVEQYNKHAFISKSLHLDSPEKATYLTISELGIPMFNIRFLLDIEDITHHYLDAYSIKYGNKRNKIAEYFRNKIVNISDSGLSNEGFIQNANISQNINLTRKKGNIKNLMKGGKKKK